MSPGPETESDSMNIFLTSPTDPNHGQDQGVRLGPAGQFLAWDALFAEKHKHVHLDQLEGADFKSTSYFFINLVSAPYSPLLSYNLRNNTKLTNFGSLTTILMVTFCYLMQISSKMEDS